MELGFSTLKDWLEVVILPVAIFAVGALLPRWLEEEKARKFLALIERELQEVDPWPKEPKADGKWYEHLTITKRFVHEEIFEKASENRDFILSLPPEVTYNLNQLWTHYNLATKAQTPEELAEQGASWCDYLRKLCLFLDNRKETNGLWKKVVVPWHNLMWKYHPELESRRLPGNVLKP